MHLGITHWIPRINEIYPSILWGIRLEHGPRIAWGSPGFVRKFLQEFSPEFLQKLLQVFRQEFLLQIPSEILPRILSGFFPRSPWWIIPEIAPGISSGMLAGFFSGFSPGIIFENVPINLSDIPSGIQKFLHDILRRFLQEFFQWIPLEISFRMPSGIPPRILSEVHAGIPGEFLLKLLLSSGILPEFLLELFWKFRLWFFPGFLQVLLPGCF